MSRTSKFADLLQTVVLAKNLVPLGRSAHGTMATVVLRENDPNAKMRFSVTDVHPSSTIVRIDHLQHLAGIRDGRWKKICDYLLVMPDDQRSWAVLVELKKTLSGLERAKEQLHRSLPVVKYLQSLCEVETENPIQVVVRHVVLVEKHSERFDKEPTRVTAGVRLQEDMHKGILVQVVVGESVEAKTLVAG